MSSSTTFRNSPITSVIGRLGLDFFTTFEDFADKINFCSVIIFTTTSMLAGVKEYVLSSMNCYIPVTMSGTNYAGFLNDFCWVHGTIPLLQDEPFPETDAEWDSYDRYRRITYYQWVPFVMLLQALCFYLPRMAWHFACSHLTSINVTCWINGLVKTANQIDSASGEKEIEGAVTFLQNLLAIRLRRRMRGRKNPDQLSEVATVYDVVEKKISWLKETRSWLRRRALTLTYIAIKVLIFTNCLLQLFLIQRFLGFHQKGSSGPISVNLAPEKIDSSKDHYRPIELSSSSGFFFAPIIGHLLWSSSNQQWSETLLFPRVAYCRVPSIRLVGLSNPATAQCVLSFNMLNEKLYLFLWFWLMLLLTFCVGTSIQWLFELCSQKRRRHALENWFKTSTFIIRSENKSTKNSSSLIKPTFDKFATHFDLHDSIFLLRMIERNAGERLVAEMVASMYANYVEEEDVGGGGDNGTGSNVMTKKPPLYDLEAPLYPTVTKETNGEKKTENFV